MSTPTWAELAELYEAQGNARAASECRRYALETAVVDGFDKLIHALHEIGERTEGLAAACEKRAEMGEPAAPNPSRVARFFRRMMRALVR